MKQHLGALSFCAFDQANRVNFHSPDVRPFFRPGTMLLACLFFALPRPASATAIPSSSDYAAAATWFDGLEWTIAFRFPISTFSLFGLRR